MKIVLKLIFYSINKNELILSQKKIQQIALIICNFLKIHKNYLFYKKVKHDFNNRNKKILKKHMNKNRRRKRNRKKRR